MLGLASTFNNNLHHAVIDETDEPPEEDGMQGVNGGTKRVPLPLPLPVVGNNNNCSTAGMTSQPPAGAADHEEDENTNEYYVTFKEQKEKCTKRQPKQVLATIPTTNSTCK
eukprot:2039064-Pyramimonas_sp.AAC.1